MEGLGITAVTVVAKADVVQAQYGRSGRVVDLGPSPESKTPPARLDCHPVFLVESDNYERLRAENYLATPPRWT